jgi:flagellar hook-length control protein FliK
MQPTWFHAGAHQAEAGFEDPALGWVSVRAGVNAGGISAVVVPGSADATQALGAHMAGLHDFLAEQRSPVESLTLAQNSGGDAGLSQSMQHQGQHQPAQDNPASTQTSDSVPHFATVATPERATQLTGSEGQPDAPGSGGRYISVMA